MLNLTHPALIFEVAVDFFSSRNVQWIVVLLCDFTQRLQVVRLLAAQGGFQVAAPKHSHAGPWRPRLLGRAAAGILATAECLSTLHTPQQGLSTELNVSHHWLIIGSVGGEEMTRWPLRLDTDLTMMAAVENNTWQLTEAYRLQLGDSMVLNRNASWDSKAGLNDTWDARLTARRADLNGMTIRSVQYVNVNMTESELRGLSSLSVENTTLYVLRPSNCLHIIFLAVAEKYNLTVKFMSVTEPGKLNWQPGKEFLYGMVGMLDRGEVDVSTTGLKMTSSRVEIMDHAFPSWNLRFICVFLRAGALGSSDALFKPFALSTWLGLFVVICVVLSIHKLFGLLGQTEPTWSASIISSIGTLTSQGFLISAEWISFRILLLTFDVFCLLMLSSYSAQVVKYLLNAPANTIHSVGDLLQAPYRGVADDWLPTRRNIMSSRDALVQRVLRDKISPPEGLGFVSMEVHIRALQTRSFATYGDSLTLYEAVRTLTNSELCQMHELDLLPAGVVGVGMAKNMSIKEHIRVGFLQALERGVTYREQTTWHSRRPLCLQGAGADTSKPVEMQPVLPALMLLLAGVAAAAALCVLEHLASTRRMLAPLSEPSSYSQRS